MKIALDEPTRTFLKLMKTVRKSLGLTQYEIAEYVGKARQTISRYEIGKRLPELLTLIKLSKILDCDISESINYKVFHRKIKRLNVMKVIKKYGFTSSELAELTGYSVRNIDITLKNKDGYLTNNIPCLFSILEILKQEKARESFRKKLLSKHDKKQVSAVKNIERCEKLKRIKAAAPEMYTFTRIVADGFIDETLKETAKNLLARIDGTEVAE